MSTGKLKAQYNRVRTRWVVLEQHPSPAATACTLPGLIWKSRCLGILTKTYRSFVQPRHACMYTCCPVHPPALVPVFSVRLSQHDLRPSMNASYLHTLLSSYCSTALQTSSIWANTIGLQEEQKGTNQAIEASIYAPGGGGRGREAKRQRAQELIEASECYTA